MDPNNPASSGLEKVLDAGAALAAPHSINHPLTQVPSAPFVLVPTGYKVHDLTPLLPTPHRGKGMQALGATESFVEYVQALKGDRTRLYGGKGGVGAPANFRALFNDDVAGEPGWKDHGATYALVHSRQWIIWLGANGRKSSMSMEVFAEFIENNQKDLTDALTMLEVSTNFQANKTVTFSKGVSLADGAQQLQFAEQTAASTKAGTIEIPRVFTISIPVFEFGTPWLLDCKFRYRINNEGRLEVWYDIDNHERTREEAVLQVAEQIAAGVALPVHWL